MIFIIICVCQCQWRILYDFVVSVFKGLNMFYYVTDTKTDVHSCKIINDIRTRAVLASVRGATKSGTKFSFKVC